jgi:drug/metabolite transporter (DMT)-like permease
MKHNSGDPVNRTKEAVLLTALSGALWGSSFPAIKIGLNYVDPYMFVFLRFLSASIIMFMVLLFTKRLDFKFAKKSVMALGIMNGFSYLLQYVGMTNTAASKSSLLVNLTAVWVAILSWLILKDRFGNKKLFGIVLSIFGVFFLTTNLNVSELIRGGFLGDVLVLFSGVGWSFFIVYSKKFIGDAEDSFKFMSWVLFITVLPLIPFIPLSSNVSLNLPVEAWAAIAYTAVFCWIVPYYLWLKGLKHISSVTSTIILLTEPVVAVILSYFMLGEGFTLISGAGAMLIIMAIILVSLDNKNSGNQVSPQRLQKP